MKPKAAQAKPPTPIQVELGATLKEYLEKSFSKNDVIDQRLDSIQALLQAIRCQGVHMGEVQDRLTREVAELREEVTASVARFAKIAEDLRAAIEAQDTTAISNAADQLDAATAELRAGTTPAE